MANQNQTGTNEIAATEIKYQADFYSSKKVTLIHKGWFPFLTNLAKDKKLQTFFCWNFVKIVPTVSGNGVLVLSCHAIFE